MRKNWTVIPLASILLMAASPGRAADFNWTEKPVAEWTAYDAQVILTNSPWSHPVRASVRRQRTEFERRDGGEMGPDTGIGYDGLENTDQLKLAQIPKTLYSAAPYSKRIDSLVLGIRWESALPVRAAELKAGIAEPPMLDSEGYLIAVYGVPPADIKGNPSPVKLGEPLKKQAVLRREGKPDVRPIRVEVFQRDDETVIAYVFPRSAGITVEDGTVQFVAAIGRLSAACSFQLEAMQFQGKLDIW